MLHDVECLITTRPTDEAVQSVRAKRMVLMDRFDQRCVKLSVISGEDLLNVILNLRHYFAHFESKKRPHEYICLTDSGIDSFVLILVARWIQPLSS